MKISAIENYLKQNQIKKMPPFMGKKKEIKPIWLIQQEINDYAREIVYQIQYNTALGNTTLVTSLQAQLQAEQQAVITRINDITEAYNNAST